ncbi:unannotated protein [freshwater metagenome]|uniref:Unannotated protein n=1 Tax=freshwater metagenome TaxID=449393 RepID=A0A6J7KAF9_9ZZZZ|nr:hypothetical protein [Actinomycetota bacterium]
MYYAANQSNDIRALSTAANQLGVTLPGNLPKMLDHLRALQTDRGTGTDLNAYAADIAQHLGNPAALAKARQKAATDIAAAEAHQRLTGPLVDRCVAETHREIRVAREQICALFGDALAPMLDTLNTEAGRLPEAFKAEQAANLDPALFEVWTRARDAHDVLTAARHALAMLYGRTTGDALFTIDALIALSYTATPSPLEDYVHAHRFARALAGTRHGGSTVGVVNIDGVFAPTALAHLGATFEWAGPAEVASRKTTIERAAVQSVTALDAIR